MLESFASWLENLPFAVAIAQGNWLFPLIESTHVLALATVFGSISMVDFRLLNLTLKSRSVEDLSREVLPWTWCAFVLAVLTGSLMFSSAASKYVHLWPFRVKMLLLLLAGINMAIFHIGAYSSVAIWGVAGGPTPLAARLSGGASLLVWTFVIICGRWVGFL